MNKTKFINIKIKSECPMLQHSDRTANPFDDITKKIKTFTGKRKKTDEDLAEISRLEWLASLYNKNNQYFLPSSMIQSALINSAKMFKLGTLIKQAIVIPYDAKFKFEHDKMQPDELYQLTNYVDLRSVRVNNSKVLRCRPIFHEWEAEFTLWLDEAKMDYSELTRIVENCGKYVGIGDYRPTYGRFMVEKITYE